MNQGSATGSRKGCAFGMDLKGGEVADAILMLSCLESVRFQGFHFHIGTGIHNPKDYEDALACLVQLRELATSAGFQIKVIDVGGGFASNTSRELTTSEMLLYQGFEKLPRGISNCTEHSFREFTRAISRALLHLFPADQLPELIYEPGRCIASPNQCLLLKVHQIKNRPGIKKWLITDGGLGTVSMPTFYEYHEVFLCNDVNRPRQEKVTITGPGCFAGDIVYRNIPMPEVHPGEILAIMDSGAYFTALESCFGYPRPAIAAVNNKEHRLVRRRETFDDMVNRDEFIYENQHERLPK
jgi:diaminopimelate decarboxylase